MKAIIFEINESGMQSLLSNLHITVNESIYLKNPELSTLGKHIIEGSVVLIDDIGLENFTFKKLANHIDTTESSIYRYFENKHRLLLYLVNWYWAWREYHLVFVTQNLEDPAQKLRAAIREITRPITGSDAVDYMDVVKLYHIVVAEANKAYLTKEVLKEEREGLYTGYHRLITRLASIVEGYNPAFVYPKALVSTLVESALLQKYFAEQIPTFTDLDTHTHSIADFFEQLVFGTLNDKP